MVRDVRRLSAIAVTTATVSYYTSVAARAFPSLLPSMTGRDQWSYLAQSLSRSSPSLTQVLLTVASPLVYLVPCLLARFAPDSAFSGNLPLAGPLSRAFHFLARSRYFIVGFSHSSCFLFFSFSSFFSRCRSALVCLARNTVIHI